MDTKRIEEIRGIRVGCLFAMVSTMCLPFLVIGTLMLVFSALEAREQARSNTATEQVEVFILSGEVWNLNSAGGQRTGGGTRNTFFPQIEFSYERNGVEVISDRYYPVGMPTNRSRAEAELARYPVGSTAKAWVLPDPDALAFLEKGWNPSVYSGIAVGMGAWAFCGGLLALSGGWKSVRLAWFFAVVLGVAVLVAGGWGGWHARTHLPPGLIPNWLEWTWYALGAAALIPGIGAAVATRRARELRAYEKTRNDAGG